MIDFMAAFSVWADFAYGHVFSALIKSGLKGWRYMFLTQKIMNIDVVTFKTITSWNPGKPPNQSILPGAPKSPPGITKLISSSLPTNAGMFGTK